MLAIIFVIDSLIRLNLITTTAIFLSIFGGNKYLQGKLLFIQKLLPLQSNL